MVKLFRFFNTLGCDTAFGAISFVFIGSYIHQVSISHFTYIALFISVVSIYNIDHLLDVSSLNIKAKSYRHAYYQKNFKALIVWQLILFINGFIILFYIPIQGVLFGFGFLIAIAIYFFIIFNYTKTNFIFREVIVAIGYSIGVALIPFMGSTIAYTINFFLLFFIIFLISLSNIWILSIYDLAIDTQQKHHSIAKTISTVYMKKMVRGLVSLTIIVLCFYTLYYKTWALGSSLIFIEIVYILLLEKKNYFSNNEYYRLIAESILIIPLLILLFLKL